MRKDICENCAFFGEEKFEQDEQIISSCRVEGPVIIRERPRFIGNRRQGGFIGEFPMIASDEWCGRHKPLVRTATSVTPGTPIIED